MKTQSSNEISRAPRLAGSGDLFARTLRTMGLLVGACVLFVGSLSTLAVVVASKAAPSVTSESEGAARPNETSTPPAPPPAREPATGTPRAAVKSQSI